MPGLNKKSDGSFIKKRLIDEISGPTGPQGPEGGVGPAGATGPAGITGTQGPQGDTGLQGPQGIQGPQGVQGLQGVTGPQGVQGIQGQTGVQGAQGLTGPQGEQGPQGNTGVVGAQGITGPTGEPGAQGLTGPRGVTGTQGNTGAAGEEGPQGPTGVQGLTGITGPAGVQGAQGDTGVAGVQGITGPAGVQGSQGDTGIGGVTGVTGYVGPVGPTGVQGEQGQQGNTGVQGQQGNTGVQGVQGLQGNTGIQGLQGLTGQTGPTGPQGVTGPRGITGVAGVQGTTGPQGATGQRGITGTQGIQGATGIQGLQGTTGPQGATGIQGTTGYQGVQGPQGPTGGVGVTGIQGPTGLMAEFLTHRLEFTTGGYMLQGKTGYGSTEQGFWMGIDEGIAKINIGDDESYLKWDGDSLEINGDVNINKGQLLGSNLRQTIVHGKRTNGMADFISAGAGLSVDIDATPDNLILSFAVGFDETGATDYTGKQETDTSISSLTADKNNYLFVERNPSTFALTFDKTLSKPYYGVNRVENVGAIANPIFYTTAWLYDSGVSRTALGQQFKTPVPITVNSIQLRLAKSGSPSGTLTVKIETDSSNLPSGTPVTNGTSDGVLESDLPTTSAPSAYAWVTFTFATPPTLEAGKQYWITLNTTGTTDQVVYVGYYNASYLLYGGPVTMHEKVSGAWVGIGTTTMSFNVNFSIIDTTNSILSTWLNANNYYRIGYSNSEYYAAQSFKLDAGCCISKVSLPLLKTGSPTGNLTVEIQTDNSGVPSNTAVTNGVSASVAESGLSSTVYEYEDFTFSTEPLLQADTTYWIVVKMDRAVSTSNYSRCRANTSGGNFAGGNCAYSTNTPTWTAVAAGDLELYITYNPEFKFDIRLMKMQRRVSGSYSDKQIVFIGEALCGAASVTSVISYAILAQSIIRRASEVINNSCTLVASYYWSHNIGTALCKAEGFFECVSPSHGYSKGDIVPFNASIAYDNLLGGIHTGLWLITDSLKVYMREGYVIVLPDRTSAYTSDFYLDYTEHMNWSFIIFVKRAW